MSSSDTVTHTRPVALIIGAGAGLSASLARAFAVDHRVVLVARDTGDIAPLVEQLDALAIDADASDANAVDTVFARIDELGAPLGVAIYNPSARVRGSIVDLDPAQVDRAFRVSAFGAFLMARLAARRMLDQGYGTLLFTGASAGVKGYANSVPFAMGKFALRGLCQSLARELHPKGVHVGHVIIDGRIAKTRADDGTGGSDADDAMLDPDAIADSYRQLAAQPRSSWAWEIELRPWTETF